MARKLGISYTRVFGGKKYFYKMSFTDRRKARMFSDSYKRAGYSIRTEKTETGYNVYARKG